MLKLLVMALMVVIGILMGTIAAAVVAARGTHFSVWLGAGAGGVATTLLVEAALWAAFNS